MATVQDEEAQECMNSVYGNGHSSLTLSINTLCLLCLQYVAVQILKQPVK
jgi:hypothetical protein